MMISLRRLFFFYFFINYLSSLFVVSTTTKSTKTTWYEIQPELTQYDDDIIMEETTQSHHHHHQQQQQRSRRRKLIWYGRYDEEMTWRPITTTTRTKRTIEVSSSQSPHPLRTDLWKLNIDWKEEKKGRRRKGGRSSSSSSTTIEFHRNGYCRIPTLGFVGEWELYPWGIRCSLLDTTKTNENENESTTEGGETRSSNNVEEYVLYATLHLNPFGEQPKMISGTILKSNPNQMPMIVDPIQDHYFVKRPPKLSLWFRKVVATFDGVGIGVDTADFSYSHRRSGITVGSS